MSPTSHLPQFLPPHVHVYHSEVCLAEGTTQYVKMEDMMETILERVPKEDLWTVNRAKAGQVIGEAYRCAEELFYTTDRNQNHETENFVFGGCGGSNTANCQLSSYRFPVGTDANRDYYGQSLGIQGAYTVKTYSELEAESNTCKAQEQADFDSSDPPKPQSELHEAFRKCIAENINKPLGHALELVFGEKTSPGFICGVKEAVKTHGKRLPGICCLVRGNFDRLSWYLCVSI